MGKGRRDKPWPWPVEEACHRLTMIHLAPFLVRGPVDVVGGRRTLIVGLGLALGPGGRVLVPGGPLHDFGCRHCLVDVVPIGSRGYATDVDFAAHLSRADGSSQVLATIRGPFRRSGCCSSWLSAVAPRCCCVLAGAAAAAVATKAPVLSLLLSLLHLVPLLSRLPALVLLVLLVTVEGGGGRHGWPWVRSRRLGWLMGLDRYRKHGGVELTAFRGLSGRAAREQRRQSLAAAG